MFFKGTNLDTKLQCHFGSRLQLVWFRFSIWLSGYSTWCFNISFHWNLSFLHLGWWLPLCVGCLLQDLVPDDVSLLLKILKDLLPGHLFLAEDAQARLLFLLQARLYSDALHLWTTTRSILWNHLLQFLQNIHIQRLLLLHLQELPGKLKIHRFFDPGLYLPKDVNDIIIVVITHQMSFLPQIHLPTQLFFHNMFVQILRIIRIHIHYYFIQKPNLPNRKLLQRHRILLPHRGLPSQVTRDIPSRSLLFNLLHPRSIPNLFQQQLKLTRGPTPNPSQLLHWSPAIPMRRTLALNMNPQHQRIRPQPRNLQLPPFRLILCYNNAELYLR